MKLKLITLRIEDRKNFQINFESIEDATVPTFIINDNQTSTVELLRFYAPSAKTKMKYDSSIDWTDSESPYRPILFQTEKGESVLFLRSIEMDNDNNQITFNLSEKIEKFDLKVETAIELEHFKDVREEAWIVNLKNVNSEITTYQVMFKLGDVEKKIALSVALKKQIYDIVIDFGSEASQILSASRDNDINIKSVTKIAESMRELLRKESKEESKEERYIQSVYEQGNGNEKVDSKLLKSVFLAKDTMSLNECDLKMLTTEEETEDLINNNYVVLPTVKLCAYGGDSRGSLISQHDYHYYRESVSRLFQSELLRLRKVGSVGSVVINCILLLPNVFTARKVSNIVERLRETFVNIIKDKAYNHVKAIEINTISESDASFVAACDYGNKELCWVQDQKQKQIENGNHFLVLDAGRGTLDASVIQYVNKKYVCKYRAGVIGAGNVVTYAYMCALIYDFLKCVNDGEEPESNDIGIFIRETLCAGDTSLVNQMWENVEKYKIVVTNKQVNNSLKVTLNNQLNYKAILGRDDRIKIFTDYIRVFFNSNNSTNFKIKGQKEENQYFPLSDEAKKYIQTLENVIAEEIANKLMVLKSQNLKINGAYYTGRAFRCHSFKKAIAKKMNDLFGDIPPVTSLCGNPNSDKLLCLLALRAIRNGNCPENTYSLPFLKTSQNNDYEGEPKGIGGEILSRFWESFSKILSMLSLNKENPSTELSTPTFTRITSSPIISSRYSVDDVDESESYDRAMRCGFTLNVTSKNANLCW